MINIQTVAAPIVIAKFPEHELFQQDVLAAIDSMPDHSICAGDDQITKTDYWEAGPEKRPDIGRPYWDIIAPYMKDLIRTISKQIDLDHFQWGEYGQAWYQQYYQTDAHSWHRHPLSVYNVVYYLELPSDAPPTLLRNPLDTTQHLEPPVKEGDIIVFPSFIKHCSPPSRSTERKTIIAFNLT